MDFQAFLNQAWSDHGTEAAAVAGRLADGATLVGSNDQIPGLVSLATHVFGEHLGWWNEGIAFLRGLQKLDVFVPGTESDKAIARSIAVLGMGQGNEQAALEFSASDQIRILAVAASALSGQGQSERARKLFRAALELAQAGLARSDPANRALAVTGNNLACELEEKDGRSETDAELMILAALAARKYWEVAGTWLETERAEYRLAMTYLKAGILSEALQHAQTCLKIAQDNQAEPLEFFFGYEALALVERARGDTAGYAKAVEHVRAAFENLNENDKAWCEETLRRLV